MELFIVYCRSQAKLAKLPGQASPGTNGMLEWLQALVSRIVALHLRKRVFGCAAEWGRSVRIVIA